MSDSKNDTVHRTIAYAKVDDLLVLCHTDAAPANDEWDRWLERCDLQEHRALLISTDGGAPSASQRAKVASVVARTKGEKPPVALLTDSPFVRSVITAFSWLLSKDQRMKAFEREAVDGALEWLGVVARPAQVRAVIARLHVALAGPKSTSR